MKSNSTSFRLSRTTQSLPDAVDFGAATSCLDARWAWDVFGGLSLSQAYEVFVSNPVTYQEAFMFMGSVAFDYYFPIIDRYLREVSSDDDCDGCQAAILGAAVAAQFGWRDAHLSSSLVDEISDLSNHVRASLQQYSPDGGDRKQIEREWRKVATEVDQYRESQQQPSQLEKANKAWRTNRP